MRRDIAFRACTSFIAGFVTAFLLIYGAAQLYLKLKYGSREGGAVARGLTLDAYADWRDGSFEPRVLGAALLGGLVCAAACCYATIVRWLTDQTDPKATASPTRGARRFIDQDLTEREFADVFRRCDWVNLDNKSPIYLQGFLVAGLVDRDVALATKLDRFSPQRMQTLLDELRRQKQHLE